MKVKPSFLNAGHSLRFKDQSVVDAYQYRLPYPNDVFDILAALSVDEPHTLLDVGTGPGVIARAMVSQMDRLDAVDFSQAMIDLGKTLPGGNDPKLRWICGPIEAVTLFPPYGLITAGDSLHWMNWDIIFPRFRQSLTPQGVIAIVERGELAVPWQDELQALIRRYSTVQDYEPFDLTDLLEQQGLFQRLGEQTTDPVVNRQSVDEYITSFHSRASLSRQAMLPDYATAFDTALRQLVHQWSTEGLLELKSIGHVVWGKPL